jgi:hypothetical protein
MTMIEPSPNPRLAQVLTYAGTLPLIGCALLAWTGSPPGMDVAVISIAYAAIIASFISGIHWAAWLFFSPRCGYLPLILSNVIALLAWISLLLGSTLWGCLLLALCFVSLLAIDRRLHAQAVLATWFYRLRRNATIIVVSMLLLVALTTSS